MSNYILAYYQAISDGTVTVGRWIQLWYQLVVRRIENGTYTFDIKKADKAIKFIENFCRHHEGALAPKLIKLELWQKALISVIFGILDKNGDRQFREAVIVIARKNGKTLLAAAISAYMAYLDGEYGGRIYYAAPKLEQACLCYDATYQMIQKEPELSELAKKRRSDIYIATSNTSLKPLAFNAKKSDGLNISLGVCDEVASWAGDQGLKFYEVLKSSLGARRQPLLLSISTAGYINDGVYDELIKRSTSVLLESSKESRLAPFLYMIDEPDKWNDINELRKSNPNMGVSVSVDYLLEEIAIAEGSLSKKAEFICKYANLKQNSSCSWLDAKTVEKASAKQFDISEFKHSYCVAGIDLSQIIDTTCCCLVIERGGELYVFSHFFLPRERLEEATATDGVPYQIFAQQGLLTLSGDNYVDYNDCFNWFIRMIKENELIPLWTGYDRYSAQYLVEQMKGAGFKMDDVYQGYNLSPIIMELGALLKDGKMHIGNNNLMKAHLLNTAVKQDLETQKLKIVKTGPRTRIDGTAALLDAMTVRSKYYGEIGDLLRNARE